VIQKPEFVEIYEKEANALRGSIGEIIFSEGTYQIEIKDPQKKEDFWPFLQIDDEGKVLDSFCSCPTQEEEGSCPHLAAAYLQIYNNRKEPLHVRFRTSFWNRICDLFSRRLGYETHVLSQEEGRYVGKSKTQKLLFSAHPLNLKAQKKLDEMIVNRVVETEETSLKFSNLSMEEITQWKEGKASHALRYELSFWSDLAKWLMLLQEKEEEYRIEFTDEVPPQIKVHFERVDLLYYIAEANFGEIIPSLATVKSPLEIHSYAGKKIEGIFYEEDKKIFRIQTEEKETEGEAKIKGHEMGEWIYVPKDGFYPKRADPLMKKSEIPTEEIASSLTQYTIWFQKHLKDIKLHTDPVRVQYQLFLDDNQSLHIQIYLFQPGDLQQAKAGFFISWAYLPSKGFYRLDEVMFEESEMIIPKEEVAEFVNRHRVWLHQFKEFQTHFGSLEAHMIYEVKENGDIKFSAELDFPEEFDTFFDFGQWIYIKNQGFYMKKGGKGTLPLRPGLVIEKSEVSHFVETHKEELVQIPGFFASRSPIHKVGLAIHLGEDEKIHVSPSIEYEEGYTQESVRLYEDFSYVEGEGFFELSAMFKLPERYQKDMVISASQESFFLNYELEKLRPFITDLDVRLQKPAELKLKVKKVEKERKRRVSFWLVDLQFVSNLGHIEATTLFQALHDKKKFLYSNAGLIHLKDSRFNWLRRLSIRRLNVKKKMIRLNSLEWIRLCIFEDVEEDVEKGEECQLFHELNTLEAHKLLDISKLHAKLRPYQELGLQWLWFLYSHGLSGILCDEMGLGKTHQAMALLAASMGQDKTQTYKYLVVCPTSVIYHWQELLKRFLPDCRVLVYYGMSRTLEDFEEKYDLLLTSYGILRTGKEDMRSLEFEVSVFDEIQIAKNHLSQTHIALKEVRSRVSVGLTGTPIENRLRELKSLFDIVLPNYMPQESVFRDQFINPIEKQNDKEKKELLTRLVKPFVLRRKKAEVLTDLPEKMEEISYCDLSEVQKELYYETAMQSRKQIMKDLEDRSKNVPYLHIFSMLSNLKQICDHPALVLKDDLKNYHSHPCGKWDLFVELLSEARESDQKVVVFSQYLDMLKIIEMHLRKKGIGYASIKGSTRNRSEQLKKFKEDPKCEVFVASLLAAGVGIDLSSASIVIHYDRWWNPAKENQATDRVHRIGQSRGVQVFKLVTKNTIEEHIHRLIEKKQHLIEETIGKDDGDQIKTLTREELIEIVRSTAGEESSIDI